MKKVFSTSLDFIKAWKLGSGWFNWYDKKKPADKQN